MAKVRSSDSSKSPRPRRPAISTEARINQLIAGAYDLVEQRIADGTASSQETTFFLKLGSPKAQLEKEKLQEENKLLRAKTEAIQSNQRTEELMEQAIAAMKKYSGQGEPDDY